MLQWNYYMPTELEKRITALYQSIGIKSPEDLQEELIATRLGIKLRYENAPSLSFEKGRYRCIVIDKTLKPKEEQRKQFFHELGHLLRGHAGDQSVLPGLFRGLQEEQADHFAKYALMPYYMIQKLDMPEYEQDVPYMLASVFKVPIDLARERWDQIKRRIARGKWDLACIEYERNRYRKADPSNWCDEAKKMFRLAIQRKMQKGQGVVIR
ncbi:ImmA/IrrE family metallo-endopeptidase [Brevibacillus thermoruber]|jgi:Zn-dependent peptidase ImmA (M78 family)|uniref:ImmA/IrrE family metallo-endopeptidase n=1 Tax=Brevibacillus thermoruber TaxID=33942 RepID=A0A9X3TQY5_9BACL|nr:ImmA/IrrE family metallo-endopeptidase [Brevibacillus thermoruber]MDA5108428.1 ImmA/IrrE family metallo-endopeptidase [Brevibacillus thermoruber]